MPTGNPLANALVIIVGVLAIAISFVIGVFALFALLAAVMILAAIIGIRVWWFNRKARKHMATGDSASASTATRSEQSVIEGEYRVVRRRKDSDKVE